MATQTAIRHPEEQKQLQNSYPHSAVFKGTLPNGKQNQVLITSVCAYEPYQERGESGEFEAETPTGDQILLPTWEPTIGPEQLLILTLRDGTVRSFVVIDALPQGHGPTQTLVLATPKQ